MISCVSVDTMMSNLYEMRQLVAAEPNLVFGNVKYQNRDDTQEEFNINNNSLQAGTRYVVQKVTGNKV